MVSRRFLLYVMALAGAALFLPGCRTSLRYILFSPEGDEVMPKPIPPNPFLADGKSLVSIVHGRDLREIVRRAVELIGGIDKLNLKGKQVLVKPNVVSSSPPPTTTNPHLVREVVLLLKDAGANVMVGDMSAIINLPTYKNMERTGIKRIAEEAGAEAVNLEDFGWVKVSPPQARFQGSFYISKLAYEADLIVNLPVIKTHRSASYSISLKNFIGIIHPRNRPSLYRARKWEEIIAEINLAVHPQLNIADGTKSMISGGPWRGEATETGLVMASGDRVAIDTAGLALIKSFGRWERVTDKSVWEQRQIKRAVEIGLGVDSADKVKIVSASLDEDPNFPRLVENIERNLKGL